LGMTQLARKELESALDQLQESLGFADRSLEMGPGIEGLINRIHGGVATAKVELSDPQGLAALEASLQNARSDHDEYGDAVISEQLARANLRLGWAEKADTYLQSPLAYYRRTSMKPYLSRALTLSADVQERLGRGTAAESARAEAAKLEQSFRVPAS
jgi:hypothetical protein